MDLYFFFFLIELFQWNGLEFLFNKFFFRILDNLDDLFRLIYLDNMKLYQKLFICIYME